MEFVLRFLRIRRPETFLLVGRDLNGAGEEFLRFVRGKTRRLGYRVSNAGMNGHGHGHAYVVGALGVSPLYSVSPEDDEGPQEGDQRPPTRRPPDRGPLALPPAAESAVRQILRGLG